MIAYLSLLRALEFIEENLRSPFSPEDVAAAAHLSLSQLNRTFARVFHVSPGNYILKRRLCAAARDLAETDRTILDIALDARFAAPESFSRAFRRQFLLSPTQYRREGRRFHDLYPPMKTPEPKEGSRTMFDQRKYNAEELREQILASKGTYLIAVDLDHLLDINENQGHAAGDAALAAVFSRIERAIADDMVFFRTGNDDFTVLTGSRDLAACEEVARKILARADEDVPCPGGSLKVSASVGIGLIPEDTVDPQAAIRYADEAMMDAKRAGRNTYRIHGE